MRKPLIYDLSFSDLGNVLSQLDEPPYRARQIWKGLYCKFWNCGKEFTILPVNLRNKIDEILDFNAIVPVTALRSSDGDTIKTLFQLKDGMAIEAVLMKYNPRIIHRQENQNNHKQGRRTICISTQVGCAMGCIFCATGQMGFRRHLLSGEIVAQVIYYARLLQQQGEVVTNVVLMGMGEPFHNYSNTMAAIDRLNDQDGYNFGARRFTISTVGLIPALRKFTLERRQVNLAISLHAADDILRSSMLPINTRYPLEDLIAVCREYIAATGRRISFEWVLINGVNDTPEQAHLLARKINGLLCHVNAIPLNPTNGYSGKKTTHQRAREFRNILSLAGIPCSIRLRRGIEIQAGCGQLVVNM